MSGYVKVDETSVLCLEPGTGKTALGYFWVYHHSEHGVLFDWHKIRANTCLDKIYIHRQGGGAFLYSASQWPHLQPCFMDGQIEFDNNLTENAIRPSKLGQNYGCLSAASTPVGAAR